MAKYYLVSFVNYYLISPTLSTSFFFPKTFIFSANALDRGNLTESHSRKGSESCVKLVLQAKWKLLCPLENRNILDFFQWTTLIILQYRMAIEPLQGLYPSVKMSFVLSHEIKKKKKWKAQKNPNQKTPKKPISCASSHAHWYQQLILWRCLVQGVHKGGKMEGKYSYFVKEHWREHKNGKEGFNQHLGP